jgi:hypothetical protein
MRNLQTITATLLLVLASNALGSESATGAGMFAKQVPGTDRQVPISRAVLTDKVFYKFVITAPDGEHLLQVTIYDGKGTEVYHSQSTLVVRSGERAASVSYGFDTNRDSPGMWWYVVALGDNVVLSNSLEVSRSRGT